MSMDPDYEKTMVAGQSPGPAADVPTEVIGSGESFQNQHGSAGMVSGAQTVILGGAPPTFAWLVLKEGPRAGQLFRLGALETTIGRDPQNDIILDDEAASRQHAKVRVEEDAEGETRFFIYDLATSNGTFVNDEQIIKYPLVDGDEVMVGKSRLVFKKI